MAKAEKESPLLLCTSCGRPADSAEHICKHCGAPLTPYAHTDPVMGAMTRGFAAHQATTKPQKAIVVIGMWLWMVPLFVFGLMLIGTAVGVFLEEGFTNSWIKLIGIPVALLGVIMVWIAGGILWKMTIRFFQASERDEQTEPLEENIECLNCGQSFSAEAEACPKCGWTYSEAEDES